ncbi:PREDICTED: protocadherin-16 [Ceratosolen solmsi marchali]|uniref:Protocadherin-16 n=1 Tax=Ceratosolen solmsi marchali TaxID=326594 RepID=A0AAJ6YT70_9HYME|nr:PREDICTED: protocadherin-16 [Ceratosolen solmsi marchali]
MVYKKLPAARIDIGYVIITWQYTKKYQRFITSYFQCDHLLSGALGQVVSDTRCFLENGQTGARLFVNEDIKIGDTIGVLSVLGDPGLQGNIDLKLQEQDSPVIFIPNSRNLTLMRPLDKEGIKGPASVYINAICERKHTLEPGYVIPINIRVTDANDNVPEFINAPYVLNISEVTVVGTRVLQGVKAIDSDQPGSYSTVQYSILPGPHADFFIFANALEGTLVLRKPLDYENIHNFSVQIRAQDQGNPPQSSITNLYVNIIDADDQNPIFLNDQYKVIIPLQLKSRKILQVDPEPIKAIDQDTGISAQIKYSIQGNILSFLALNSETADIIVTRPLQDHELISSAILVIKAVQIDNPDRYALATILVSRESNIKDNFINEIRRSRLPVRFIFEDYHASISENTPPGSIILTAGVNKIDPNLKFWLIGANEDLEKFSITNSGELILKSNLDYERRIYHSFRVHVMDKYNNDTARINVSVEDVNEWEPRFRHPKYEFHVRTIREGSIIGKVEVADGDRGDKISLALRGPDSRSFEIHDNGELVLRFLGSFNGTIARLVAIASDTGKPPRSSMIPVIVHLPKTESTTFAARGIPAWLGSSVLLVAVFGVVLGLLGVIILILILYIYKHKRPKSRESLSSVGTEHREKSVVPSALNPTPHILGATILQDTLEIARDICCASHDIDNPVFGEENDFYNTTIKSIVSSRQIPFYSRHKVAPGTEPPTLCATSNIPNIGGLVQNMNDLGFQNNVDNMETCSQNSSNFSGDPPDSLAPTWPIESISKKIKTLSLNNNDRIMDNIEITTEPQASTSQANNEHVNLTVYF